MRVAAATPQCFEEANTFRVMTSVKKGLYKAFKTVCLWKAKSKQRRQLRELLNDSDRLNDLGISSDDARLEANKPFWK